MVTIDGWIEPQELMSGDVIFCSRPGPLRYLCDRSSDGWTHVAIVSRRGDETFMLEVAGDRFGSRPITGDALASYDAVAIGRVGPKDRMSAQRAADSTRELIGTPQRYAWDDFVLAGFIGVTRRSILPGETRRFARSLQSVLAAVEARSPSDQQRSVTCSTLVFDALTSAGCDLAIDLASAAEPTNAWSAAQFAQMCPAVLRAASGSRMELDDAVGAMRAVVAGVVGYCRPSAGLAPPDKSLDPVHLARWLTPGDLWRSPTLVQRFALNWAG